MKAGPEKTQLHNAFLLATQLNRASFREPVRAGVKTFWGDYLNVTLPETVSIQIAFQGYYEKDLTHVLIECLEPGMTFIDIGAHYGYFTLLAAKIVGEAGAVHSFEPTLETYRLLIENVAGRTNVTVNNKAVYSKTTELPFRQFGADHSAFNSLFEPRLDPADVEHLGMTTETVAAVSIDDYVAATGIIPNFVKIDAESAERFILEGMQETLKRHRPMFTLEVGDGDLKGVATSHDLVKYACSFGYRPFTSRMGMIMPHQIQTRYSFDNILFLPR